MNQLVERSTTEVAAAPEYDPFDQYAQTAQRNIVGQLLKFSKGDYLSGQDNALVPVGTKLIANMNELLVGWIKWKDSKPVEQIMGRLTDGYKPLQREELGDDNQDLWEVDEVNHQPRDPWQETNYLLMKTPGVEELFTFTSSSKGGLGAIKKLCGDYSKGRRQRPDEMPLVSLDVDSYAHSNKAFGRIKFPVFTIVDWVSQDEFASAAAAAADQGEDLPF